jgi:hypothetical protein
MKVRFSFLAPVAALALCIGVGPAHGGPINVLASGGDIDSTDASILAARGINLTIVSPGALDATIAANPTLAGFQGVWLGWATNFSVSAASATDLRNFVIAGGSFLGETPFGNILAFGPDGGSVAQNGSGGNSVHIVAPGDPVMAGLTDAGLSGWDSSYHGSYTATGAFTVLAIGNDNGGLPVTITELLGAGRVTFTEQDASFHMQFGSGDTSSNSPKANLVVNALTATVTPEPSTLILLGVGAACVLGYRRPKPSVRA